MYKPAGYYRFVAVDTENWTLNRKLRTHPNPHPLGEFSKPVADYLCDLIRLYVEDTGNLPTPNEYLDMTQNALENAVR